MLFSLLAPALPQDVGGPITVQAYETTAEINRSHDFTLPAETSHIAIHWPGDPAAAVAAAFSSDGATFSPPVRVEIDDVGASRRDGETYGALMEVDGVRIVRVTADRPLGQATLLALNAAGEVLPVAASILAAGATAPPIIPRSGWGADESIRYDDNNEVIWPTAFFPLQKMIIHHTATGTGGSNPAATVRAIYYYHAVTQGWGDIGYNYLIDAAGRVYEGRYSRDYPAGTVPSSDDEWGQIVEAGHSYHHNPGSLGVAVIGDYRDVAPTAATRSALIRLLAWVAERTGVDPRRSSTYVNPVSGTTRTTQNIAGHRDYNATSCPGGQLDALLPSIRGWVAAMRIGRMAGADRYGTAAAVSNGAFAPGVPVAYVATGLDYPDALAASGAAAAGGGPVLLVTPSGVPIATASALARIHPGRIVIVGGPAAVSEGVRAALDAYTDGPVDRLFGADRYATAAAVSAATFAPGAPVAFVATGTNYPDALAASSLGGPVLLVPGTTIPGSVASELTRLRPGRIVVVGGPGAVSEGVRAALDAFTDGDVSRLAGADRYATAAAVSAANFSPRTAVAYVATGRNFPDALAAGSAAATGDGPILLAITGGLPTATAAELARLEPGRIVVVGGTGVVSEVARLALGAYPTWPQPPPPPPP
jgi:putative cell wall-binding protein